MSRAVSCFLSLLRDDESNDIIDDMWDELSPQEQIEAVTSANENLLALMSGRDFDHESAA